jgi:hypothetical protein
MLAMQALYSLSYIPSLCFFGFFCSCNFEDKVSFLPQVSLDHNEPILSFPHIIGMTGVRHYAWLFSTEMESHKFLCWPGTAILPISVSHITLEDRCMPLRQAIGWGGGSHKLFASAGLKPWSSWSLPPE